MQLQTKYLGTLDVDASKAIEFPNGLPGFPDETRFYLLDFPGNPLFQIMQSAKTRNTAFIVVSPFHFQPDYKIDLDNQLLETLHIQSEKDVVVLAIVTLKQPFQASTINLKAPIIINSKQKLGRQYILSQEDFLIKAPIVPTEFSGGEGE